MRGLGIIFAADTESEERSDYRPVPRSDRGNEGYRDRGMLGSYATNDGEPFPAPRDVRFFTGFGGSASELERGYAEPLITDNPAYDLASYKDRSSEPQDREADDDWRFRNRNRRSEGFLTRPRIPNERG